MTKQSKGSPAPIGHYTPAMRHGDLVFFSGQTPIDPATGKLVDGGIAEQTARALANLADLLKKEGLTWNHVLRAGVFITDMSNFAAMNTVYSATLGDAKPARTTVAVYQLPLNALVEIDMVASVSRRP
jgi:2-iminobutanoate/2-iminopropanoate deaminase